MEPIPNRQATRPIRINLVVHDRVMNPVQARRHDQSCEARLERGRQLNVGMVKHDLEQQSGLPKRKGKRANTDEKNLRRAPWDRKNQLTKMKTQRGRGIHVEIGVMGLMKAPEKRQLMSEDMPEIKRVIEQRDRERDLQPRGQPNEFEQAEPAPFHETSEWPNDRLFGQLHAESAERRHRKVAGVPAQFGFDRAAQGPSVFQPD